MQQGALAVTVALLRQFQQQILSKKLNYLDSNPNLSLSHLGKTDKYLNNIITFTLFCLDQGCNKTTLHLDRINKVKKIFLIKCLNFYSNFLLLLVIKINKIRTKQLTHNLLRTYLMQKK